tara:strand:- start:307 stop:1917 length:1611 start_codon:yes stop_codon:yes gene_type:complete
LIRILTIISLCACFALGLNVESGGKLSREQAAIDVKHYKIDIRVDPYKKTIIGTVEIIFELLESTEQLTFDLLNRYSVSGTSINNMNLSFKKENHKVKIANPGLPAFKEHLLTIKYGGKPPVAKNPPWDGGVTWSIDSEGYPWVGVSCQTNGAHIWFPCKEHPSDKADGAEIIITAPEQLIAVGNGLLISKEKQKDRWTRWHWKTNFPISPYNINFAIGNFELVETTSYLFEDPLKIEYYVLPEKLTGATGLLREAEEHVQFYARAFGAFPWTKERLGIVHTPFSGMEHQTSIAYGNDYKKTRLGYDFILLHELGHEWWGNFLSVSDWSELWIHEGICTYSEVMYVEEKFGQEAMHAFVKERLKKNIINKTPIIPPHGSTAKHKSGNDVYYKAAHVLHSIRYFIGKDVLWKSLKEFLNMPKELENNQTSTKEFIALLNENSKNDLSWIFEQYMEKKDLPTLLIKEKKIKEKRFIDLWWEEKNFKMPVEISYKAIEGSRTKIVDLDNKPKRFVVPDSTGYVLDPNGWILFNVKQVEK